ncbi:MAG: hypothetical protein M3083_15345 [Actinomycetota bacterium]|nr:hypothetical protein [Actinomycetota bacterium]
MERAVVVTPGGGVRPRLWCGGGACAAGGRGDARRGSAAEALVWRVVEGTWRVVVSAGMGVEGVVVDGTLG